jgi:hypothetical protein
LYADRISNVDAGLKRFAPGGPWREWLPIFSDAAYTPFSDDADAPGPMDRRMLFRVAPRLDSISRRLALRPVGGADVSLPQDCERTQEAAIALLGESPCDALREYIGCKPPIDQPPNVPIDEQIDHGHEVYEQLLRECEGLTPENTVVECSGPPCVVVTRVDDPDMTAGEAFCDNSDVGFNGNEFPPGFKVGVLFSADPSADPVMMRRMSQEVSIRIELAIEQLERLSATVDQ